MSTSARTWYFTSLVKKLKPSTSYSHVSKKRSRHTSNVAVENASVCKNQRILGKGAFGLVCSRKGKAIKVQLKCKTNQTWCKEQNHKELLFFKKVAAHHPSFFMQLHSVSTKNNFYILELEKMDGTFAQIHSTDPMHETRRFFQSNPLHVCTFLLQMFSALNFMRAHGFNHTDLHQGNIAYVRCSEATMNVFPYFGEKGTVQSIRAINRGIEIPTFGRLWKIIDYGLVTKGNVNLVDERLLFIRFLITWRRAHSFSFSSATRSPDFSDEFPQLDIEEARRIEPTKVSFVESLSPPGMMRVGGPEFMQENEFATAYELFFGTDAYLDILFPGMPKQEKKRWKRKFGIQESMVPLEDLVFYYQCKTKIEEVLVPRLLQRLEEDSFKNQRPNDSSI